MAGRFLSEENSHLCVSYVSVGLLERLLIARVGLCVLPSVSAHSPIEGDTTSARIDYLSSLFSLPYFLEDLSTRNPLTLLRPWSATAVSKVPCNRNK